MTRYASSDLGLSKTLCSDVFMFVRGLNLPRPIAMRPPKWLNANRADPKK